MRIRRPVRREDGFAVTNFLLPVLLVGGLAVAAFGARSSGETVSQLTTRLAFLQTHVRLYESSVARVTSEVKAAGRQHGAAMPSTTLDVPEILTYYNQTLTGATGVKVVTFTFTPASDPAPGPSGPNLGPGVSLNGYPINVSVSGSESQVLAYIRKLTLGPWLVTITSVSFPEMTRKSATANISYELYTASARLGGG